jgi:sporulation protein YlmC with PRC-barrel domain
LSTLTARSLIGASVRARDVVVGTVDDVVLGADLSVVLGFVVETRNERRCFLPWVAAQVDVEAARVSTESAVALLGDVELLYYLDSGVRAARLTGLAVDDPDGGTSLVTDVLLDEDGSVRGIALTAGGGTRIVSLDDTRIHWRSGKLLDLAIGGAADPVDAPA